jgi:hypothetical protein
MKLNVEKRQNRIFIDIRIFADILLELKAACLIEPHKADPSQKQKSVILPTPLILNIN